MELNVAKEVAALERMTVNELRERYAEAFCEPTRVRHTGWLVRRIIWRLQAQAEGDLSERARRRAAELANDADLRTMPPRAPRETVVAPERTMTGTLKRAGDGLPPPGSVITREYKGRTLRVPTFPLRHWTMYDIGRCFKSRWRKLKLQAGAPNARGPAGHHGGYRWPEGLHLADAAQTA